jgi:cephalosporin hydroxylase
VNETSGVETFQNLWELDQMLAVFERLMPERVLEIGCWHGGTLWHWLRVASAVVVIDDEMRLADEWKKWAQQEDAVLHLLQGFSQDEHIIDQARGWGEYDWVFVDGDHRYDAVKADWENYRDMVNPGGVFVFHDTQHVGDDTYGVEQLWNEITAEEDVCWMHVAKTGHCGIGMVWL